MLRSWQIKRRLLIVYGVFTLAVVTGTSGLLATGASAGTGLARSAAPAAQNHSFTAKYACDLSNYGYTGPAVDINATLEFATPVDATSGLEALFFDHGLNMSLVTTVATLPASVADQLTNLAEVDLRATLPVAGEAEASPTAVITGSTAPQGLVGPLTQLPVILSNGTAWLSRPGTAWLNVPPRSLVFTPVKVVGNVSKNLPSFTCTAARTSIATAKVAVGGQAIKAPFYGCLSTYRSSPYRTPLPMAVTVSGVRSVGHTVTVALSSPETGIADPAPFAVTKLKFRGSVLLRGAQTGEIALDETTTKASAPTFKVAARLRLTRSGTDRIYFPQHFVYTESGPTLTGVFTCSLATTPAPVALTFKVAR
jgi:hypothetical protein